MPNNAKAEHNQALDCAFMVTEAPNQWAGADCEAWGRVRVHFALFQALPAVRKSAESLESVVRRRYVVPYPGLVSLFA